MCTMSWFKTEDGYELFFNRDEQKKRRRALLPEVYTDLTTQIISPTDADAGGTWISVNEYGLTFCLLNHYEKEQLIPHKDWLSRGEIIRTLASYDSLDSVVSKFNEIDLSNFKPFRLFILNPEGRSYLFTWDALELMVEQDVNTPRSSSSFEPEKVRASRKALFKTMGLHESKNREDFLKYHTGHTDGESPYSVCMHREDAGSVSLSHIVVNNEDVSFSYADGAPCEAPLGQPIIVGRLATGLVIEAAEAISETAVSKAALSENIATVIDAA